MSNQANGRNVSVGLETRTSDKQTTIGVVGTAEALGSLGGLQRAAQRLGGRRNSAVMAGGERYVQSESLKSFGLSRCQVSNPRLRRRLPLGPWKAQTSEEIMEFVRRLLQLTSTAGGLFARDDAAYNEGGAEAPGSNKWSKIMNTKTDRRTVIAKSPAAALAAGAVTAPPMVAEANDLEKLNTLIEAHTKAIEVDIAAWRALADIEAVMEDNRPIARVQIGRLFRGRDDEGNEISDPIWAYDESDIESGFAEHRNIYMDLFARTDTEKAKYKSIFDEKVRLKKDELAAIEAEVKKIDHASGHTEALAAAMATTRDVKTVEAEIISLVPESVDTAALKAKWLISAHASEFSYVENEHLMPALSAIAEMSPKHGSSPEMSATRRVRA